ncbi:MAG: amino acid permease [Anaerolineales bacterium]
MPTEASEAPQLRNELTLSRTLSLFTVTMIGVGGMIGAGIFVLTGTAAGVAGPALILAFLLNGVITTFTALSYAELGSKYPEAGGSYAWVQRALGGVHGFLAGWMSWFANAVAGSLYALAFGRFAVEVLTELGGPTFGLTRGQLALLPMGAIILVFTSINLLGASETGLVGNVVTMTKVLILGLFILFGLLAIYGGGEGLTRFTADFMPAGPLGVLVAMGLTFIAFEGYEIIAQSGEEVIDPQRNIPRAIFISIGLVVAIYLLVAISAIGAVQPPTGMTASAYLGEKMELAVVEVASQTFPRGLGSVVLLVSGLASTMSALNATTYSSSRVSFAMGRDRNLPGFFSTVHPERHTPYGAVLASGGLMLLMALALPLEDVAAAADIMFLLLFIQVNVALLRIRRSRDTIAGGFTSPLFPFLPLLAIVANAGLAAYLVVFSPTAWVFTLLWLAVGVFAYTAYFARKPAMASPNGVILEEVQVSRQYSVLVPVADAEQGRILGAYGAALAAVNQGEVLALHVIHVPPQLPLTQGRLFLDEARAVLDSLSAQAELRGVPIHRIVRLGRIPSEAVGQTAIENGTDLILLGWEGFTRSSGRRFGSVIDPIVDNPPADVAVLRARGVDSVRRILVPVAGGPNSRLAVSIAAQLAAARQDESVDVEVVHIVPTGADDAERVRAKQVFDYCLQGIDDRSIRTTIIEADAVGDAIVTEAVNHDLVIIGATEEPLFKNILVGTLPAWVARHSPGSVMMVKRRSGRLQSMVRRTLLKRSLAKRRVPQGRN